MYQARFYRAQGRPAPIRRIDSRGILIWPGLNARAEFLPLAVIVSTAISRVDHGRRELSALQARGAVAWRRELLAPGESVLMAQKGDQSKMRTATTQHPHQQDASF